MAEKYTFENFLSAITSHPQKAEALLTNDFKFTAEGVVELCQEYKDACKEFFSKLIGESFNADSDEDVAKVIKIGRSTDEKKAEVCLFIYNCKNFPDEVTPSKQETTEHETITESESKPPVKEEKSKTETVEEKSTEKTKEHSKGFSPNLNPFRAKTIQYDIFNKLTDGCLGKTRDEIVPLIEHYFVAHGKDGVGRLMVLNNTVSQSAKKGIPIKFGKESKVLEFHG